MLRRSAPALLSLLFLVLSLVPPVAAPDVDLTDFDNRLGDAFGIGAFGGGLILTFVILFFFLGMLGIVSKRAPSMFTVMLLSFCILSACIAIGWFPVWSLIFLLLLLAFMFGSKMVGSIK